MKDFDAQIKAEQAWANLKWSDKLFKSKKFWIYKEYSKILQNKLVKVRTLAQMRECEGLLHRMPRARRFIIRREYTLTVDFNNINVVGKAILFKKGRNIYYKIKLFNDAYLNHFPVIETTTDNRGTLRLISVSLTLKPLRNNEVKPLNQTRTN